MPGEPLLDLQTLITTLNNVVVQIGNLTKQIRDSSAAIFPQTSGSSTSATAGGATLPANPAGFLDVNLNGSTVKVPYYNS